MSDIKHPTTMEFSEKFWNSTEKEFLDDLDFWTTREFNLRMTIQKHSKEEIKKLRDRRRKLKNRGKKPII